MGDRLPRVLIVLVVAGALGPYLTGGIRTEQAVIYGLLVLVVPFRLLSMRLPATGVVVASAWTTYLLAGLVGIAVPAINRTPWGPQSALAGLDNLLLPLALIILMWAAVGRSPAQPIFMFAARVVAVAGAANGVLALVMTRVDLGSFTRAFAAPAEATYLVTDLAAVLGRYSGVFSLPAEAGLAYAVAGLAACYGWRHRPALMYGLLALITLGGIVCVSKVFILGGLPLIVWQVIRSKRGLVTLVFIVPAATLVLLASGLLSDWSGLRYLAKLVGPGDGGFVTLYTANRLGSESTLASVVETITGDQPVWGYGLAGLRVPYDNGWVEALVVAGAVGAVAYTATLVALFWTARTDGDRDRRSFLTSLAILAAGASIGLPALTANRAGTLLWLLVALGALAHSRRRPLVSQGEGVDPAGLDVAVAAAGDRPG